MLFLFFHSRGFSRLDRQCEAVLFGVARPDEVGALDVHLLLMFRIKMFVIITIIIFFLKKEIRNLFTCRRHSALPLPIFPKYHLLTIFFFHFFNVSH